MPRYQWVQQESGEDCAAASLAIVARHYGRDIRIDRIREAVSTDSGGTTFASLKRGAESLGFLAKGTQAAPELLDRLHSIPLPAIIYWKGYHVLVLYGPRRGKYVVSDPGLGIRHLSREELMEGWQGRIMLLLRPHPVRFWLEDSDHVSPFGHLVRRLAPYRFLWISILLLSAVTAGLGLGLPLLLQVFVDDVLRPAGQQETATFIMALCAWHLTNSGTVWARSMLADGLAQKLAMTLTSEFGLQLLNLPLSYHESRSGGLVRNRLGDLLHVSSIVTGIVADLPMHLLVAVVGASVLAAYDVRVLAVVGLGALVDVGVIALLLPMMKQASQRVSSAAGESFFMLAQFFSNALTVRTLGAARTLESELHDRLNAEAEASTRNLRLVRSGWAVTRLLSGFCLAGLLWCATFLLFRGQLTLGQLVAVSGISLTVLGAVTSVALFAMNATQVRAATRLLVDVFALTPEDALDGERRWVALSPRDDVTCEGIAFQYAGRLPLFQNLSVRFPGGRVSAIVGHSGSGKSTLACLIAGLYGPHAGSIRLGHRDLSELSLHCRRRQITMVPQETRFLTRSVTDNLRLGAPEATAEEIEAACRLSAAHDFVRALPEGYDTVLGDFSARLSAGEKQRLSIARALLLDPAVLILDECSSSLDARAEAEVLNNVLASREGKTTILMSHRPAVVQRAEWIVLLDQGRVRFAGPLEELRRASVDHLDFLTG